MEYQIEWRNRIRKWMGALVSDLYEPLADISWDGFATAEQLSCAQAMTRPMEPMKRGTRWGKEWEYLWVRGQITLPEGAAGKRIVLKLDLGGECCVYLNGEEFCGRRNDWVRDQTHKISDLTISFDGRPGETYDIAVETYSGHEFPGVAHGPVVGLVGVYDPESNPGNYHPKKPDDLRASIGECSFGVWNELAYQLYIDVKFLNEALGAEGGRHGGGERPKAMPEESLRYWDIWNALKDFTLLVDFEQDAAGRNRDYQAARERLAPIFELKNGPTTPEFFAFGHAHIDVAWLWPLAETERKVMRTFAGQLRNMDEYPTYKFLQSQPHIYRWAKEKYPKMYKRIQEKVKNGQWICEGGMWVEADTNVSSGEALIRQFVHGKRYFMEEFGVDNKMLWLPDVFGYSGALPQIMQGCGVPYFSTQKIWWAYNGGEKFPHQYFRWIGIDGTAVDCFLHEDYNSETHPGRMIGRWHGRKQKNGIRGFPQPYGYGDGGGGPCREHIEYTLREEDFEGVPKVKNASPIDFFEWHPAPVEEYVGELYLQVHRGVQTSQAKTKKGNRKSELALREVEFMGVLAKLAGADYPLARVDEHWKTVLLNQFHDILPGSSIARVYKEAEAMYAEVLDDTALIQKDLAAALVKDENAITVFNSLNFDRTAIVELPEGFGGAAVNGEPVPVQAYDGKRIAKVFVPSCGAVTVTPAAGNAEEAFPAPFRLTEPSGVVLENAWRTVVFDAFGEITSIIDKETGVEWLAGKGNEMKLFKDIPVSYEAWDIDTNYELQRIPLTEPADFELLSAGPVNTAIRITRRFGNSTLSQVVSICADHTRIDFETTVDWRETHKMLKVGFAPNIHSDEAVHNIQYGYVKRPNHRSRPFDFDRFEVVNHHWTALCEEGRGFAVLNDCKYGCNVLGNEINLTLLRSPFSPDPQCDHGIQTFTYSCYLFAQSLGDSGLIQQGYDLNVPVQVYPGAAKDFSALDISVGNIILEALKPAEDGSPDYILRLYEAVKKATDSTLTLRLPASAVSEVNMLEEDGTPVEFEKTEDGVKIPLSFRAFEIKTLRITP